jgi:hypothetical protein
MDFIKKLIGGQEEPIEQRRETNSIAEQSIPVSESYQPTVNTINNNKNTSSSKKSSKKTRKMATIVRPRNINVQKIPKSMKNRISNLENTVTNYGSKANKYIDDNKQQVADLENKVVNYENKIINEKNNVAKEIVYVPIVFRTWISESGQGQPIEFIKNNSTKLSLDESSYRHQTTSGSLYYNLDVISQLKYLKYISISGWSNFIINGQVNSISDYSTLEMILKQKFPNMIKFEHSDSSSKTVRINLL